MIFNKEGITFFFVTILVILLNIIINNSNSRNINRFDII